MSVLEHTESNEEDIINYQSKYEIVSTRISLVVAMQSTLFPKKISFSEVEKELSFLISTREALAEIQIDEDSEIEVNC